MLIKQVMEVFDVLDSSTVDGAAVKISAVRKS